MTREERDRRKAEWRREYITEYKPKIQQIVDRSAASSHPVSGTVVVDMVVVQITEQIHLMRDILPASVEDREETDLKEEAFLEAMIEIRRQYAN